MKEDVFVPSLMIPYKCTQKGRCCGVWNISMDKKSYTKLKKCMASNNFFSLFRDNVKRNRQKGNKSYAYIKLKNGKCGLLTSTGLCTIHKEFGIGVLPDICKVYPRLVYKTPFGKELSMTFSCPEAAGLLRSRDKIRMIKNPDNYFFSNGNLYSANIPKDIFYTNGIIKFYYELEYHFTEIMQCRRFRVDERLILLGLTIRQLETVKNYDYSEIERIIKRNKNIMLSSFFAEEVKKVNHAVKLQVILLKEFVRLRLINIPYIELRKSFKRLSKRYLFGLEDEFIVYSIENYVNDYFDFYFSNSKEFEHIIENYIVFYILRKSFALYKLRDGYFLLIFFYSLIRIMAISLSWHNKEKLNEDILIKAIWIIEKVIGHSYNFYTDILNFLKNNELTSISHGITLLKMPN